MKWYQDYRFKKGLLTGMSIGFLQLAILIKIYVNTL